MVSCHLFINHVLQASHYRDARDQHTNNLYVYVFSDYGERAAGQSWTVSGTKVVKLIPVSSPEKTAPKPSDQVTI